MSADLYPRPSREVIAEIVKAQMPGADDPYNVIVTPREPELQASAPANFAVYLRARMRVLGLDVAALADRVGLTKVTVTRALNGVPVGLDVAEKLALAVGGYLATMIGPYMCATCAGEPPKGFRCLECGTEARAA